MDEIMAQVQIIAERFNPEKIILFGSYAKGQPTPESDVDLFIIIDSDKPTWEVASEIALAIDHIFPLDIVVRNREENKLFKTSKISKLKQHLGDFRKSRFSRQSK